MIEELKKFKDGVMLQCDNIENKETNDLEAHNSKGILEAMENVEKNEEKILENFSILKVRNKIANALTLVIHWFL